MLCLLIAWDSEGNVIATLDALAARDERGAVHGLVDFETHEVNGGRFYGEVWRHPRAAGSATWPEWIGARAHDFKVELDPNPSPARARIKALVHKKSGHRRERAAIEAEIEKRINEAKDRAKKKGDEQRHDLKRRKMPDEMVALVQDPEPDPVDLRDLLGGPGRPLLLDENGRTKPRVKRERPNLPVVARMGSARPSDLGLLKGHHHDDQDADPR